MLRLDIKLWHLCDCTDYALNLSNCPVAAYSGEDDRQKQAADIMAKAMEEQRLKLPDWAVIDVTVPPSSRWRGRVVDAGFFGERWELLDTPN